MPVDNRRIAGPEVTQRVVFTEEKALDKPLVRKEQNPPLFFSFHFVRSLSDFVVNLRSLVMVYEEMAGRQTNFDRSVSCRNKS